MGLAFAASPTCPGASLRRATLSDCSQRLLRGSHAVVRSAAGASLPPGRVVLAADRAQQQSPGRLGAQAGNGAERGVDVARERSTVATAAAMATSLPATEQVVAPAGAVVKAPVVKPVRRPEPVFVPVPEDVITDFEHKLEADLQTVGVTLTAILGVIIFWRGVWALLDHFIGDSVVGDICCIIVGLTIVLYIRLSGMKIASFWPPS
ncbi:hypothetical protein CHLRE_04g220633v5 [Chlamydomonas reinhardtii]|uniref:Uncharacterized protein n=1 Tax=Chlamydomonas reinhardtii TaxID=3055 RepID=A8ISU0_CHLRE|nr:uncharacterized protein CHLRE_04g220633v5 [Chlamydomonas reinhardtii]XP_042925244.1 uncharacterized protein CHLRE_04g220633v5 [Chlamydomonas reinhardtii]PNW84093.1 hypothetical protein CHLRE_04g220633v5 [Chlamydomonas reinhardtii]PNW84094.1 hypothetical protein CHLRE_04g220633v5 [Chlamydomonas reinhardtii]|eukprot:XP_001692170.1 predicted protein [Chlamydomonas reinhardtii]